nr:hypothetical protein BaRGS_009165 [Batillaria attramentaria]
MSLELEPKTQDRDQTLNIICLWENGNPPVTARLLDRHGVEMEGNIYSSGQIRYRFPAVGCQDAGLIRCEAPGASHNKTVMLLVKYSMGQYHHLESMEKDKRRQLEPSVEDDVYVPIDDILARKRQAQ